MRRQEKKAIKKPGFISLICAEVQEVLLLNRTQRRFTRAQALLKKGDIAPMERLTQTQLGDAWLALANYYAIDRQQDAVLATTAYRKAVNSTKWLDQSSFAQDEYDRRCLLGIGIEQNLQALAERWSGLYESGYQRETQLAWIYGFGPTELRDQMKAWWWVALAEARWGQLQDVQLPTLSAVEVREQLVKSLREKDRQQIELEAKAHVHQEFVRSK